MMLLVKEVLGTLGLMGVVEIKPRWGFSVCASSAVKVGDLYIEYAAGGVIVNGLRTLGGLEV